MEASKCEDKCSVDDLVSFINGGDGGILLLRTNTFLQA